MSSQAAAPLCVEKLVFGGSGLGFHRGKAVFVPYSVPGDIIYWETLREKRHYCFGRLKDVSVPSSSRVEPRCPHFVQCGGCQWQHISISEQLRWKQEIFESILAGKCGVARELIRPIIPSPEEWHYRSRARIQVRWQAGEPFAGFFQPESHRVCSIKQCLLLAPLVETIFELFKQHLLSGNAIKKSAGIEHVILETGDQGGSRILVCSNSTGKRREKGSKAGPAMCAEFENAAQNLVSEASFPLTIMVKHGKKTMTVAHNQKSPMMPVIHPQGENGVSLQLPPGGFSQINLAQNRTLVKLVIEAVSESNVSQYRLLDLYCGMGNFTLPLAPLCSEIMGVDYDAGAIRGAEENCRLNNIENARFLARPVEAFVQEQQPEWDIVVLDPPRSGAMETVKAISHARVPVIVYVSCDPMTLARDVAHLLDNGYALRWSQPVDMFPQTYHIESVTVLDHT